MVIIDKDRYVVLLPEYSLVQDINPNTQLPFKNEKEAKDWEKAELAKYKGDVDSQQLEEENKQKARKILSVYPERLVTEVGVPLTVEAYIKDGLGNLLPFTREYNAPIQDGEGNVVAIKMISFVNGKATASYTPKKSGYLYVTEKKINEDADPNMYLELPNEVKVIVYE